MKKIALSLLLTLFVMPFVYLFLLSMASEWRFPDLLPHGLSLSHWIDLGSAGGNWGASFMVSLLIALSVASCATVCGFLTAWQLAWHPRRQLWMLLAYFPYAFSPVIYAHCLKFFFNVSHLSGSIPGVVLAQFILTYPFAILLFFNHFDHTLRSMEHLTYTLGGSVSTVFWKVLAPVSRTVLLICFFQTFLISWFEYGLTSVIGLGLVRTLTIGVYQYIGESNIYVAALASCLVSLPPLLLLWLNQRYIFRKNETVLMTDN